MPLGNPEGPTATVWKITANSVDAAGGYPVSFSVDVSADNPDAAELPGVVQQFVDMIGASPHFKLLSATRSYSYSESMTPTT